jgi:AraC family transcriptional activator of pobA
VGNLFTENFIIRSFPRIGDFRSLWIFEDALAAPALQLSAPGSEKVIHQVEWMHEEYASCPTDAYQEDLLRGSLYTLLLRLERERNTGQEADLHPFMAPYLQFRHLVRVHCKTVKKVEFYAQQLGFSAKKLNYVCQHVVRLSAKQVISQQLLLEAKRLLAGTDMSIKEIGYALGFDEPTNFVKYFQKLAKQTPGQFRG